MNEDRPTVLRLMLFTLGWGFFGLAVGTGIAYMIIAGMRLWDLIR